MPPAPAGPPRRVLPVTILRDRTVTGLLVLSQINEIEPGIGLPLDEALAQEWETDAHMVPYYAVDEHGQQNNLRINKRGPALSQIRAEGGDVRMTAILLDWDLPEHRVWRDRAEVDEFLERLAGLTESSAPTPAFVYITRAGARLVYALTEPITPELHEGVTEALRLAWGAVGVEVPPHCRDWTHLYRLPKVVRDGAALSAEPWFELLDGGPLLDPKSITPAAIAGSKVYAEVDLVTGDRPSPEACHALLYEQGKGNREKMTVWHKTARTWLQGRDAHSVCFDHVPVDESKGRNNELTRLLGQAIGMLFGREGASPEGVFALFAPAVEQLSPDADTPSWLAVAWDLTLRLWNAEASQHEAQVIAQEAAKEEALEGIWPAILRRLRAAHPHEPALAGDDAAAQVWAEGRLIAAAPKGNLFVMRPDGTYSPHGCPPELLLATIRDLGMEAVIPITEVKGQRLAPRSIQDIYAHHVVPVHKVEATATIPHTMLAERGATRSLVVKVHELRSDLDPMPDRRVEDWLRQLGGQDQEHLLEWLSHSLDVGRGICLLALLGASGAGKDMLVAGLAECFETPNANGEAALGKFNSGLLENPVIHCAEGIPNMGRDAGRTPDQIIRALVSGGNISIEPKGRELFHGHIYPRVILTANNLRPLQQLCGRNDLGEEDLAAIGQRLLYIDVPKEATKWLSDRGNYDFTAGWVQGSGGNDYVLARHLLWMHETRKPARATTGRLLVEGSRSNKILADHALRTPAARAVIRALLMMIEAHQCPEGLVIHEHNVYVTPAGVANFYERMLQHAMRVEVGPREVARVLRLLYDGVGEPGSRRLNGVSQRWWRMRQDILLLEAVSAGYGRLKLEALYAEKNGALSLDHLLKRAPTQSAV